MADGWHFNDDREETLLRAIHIASEISEDFSNPAGGALARCVKHLQENAIDSLKGLVNVNPTDTLEILRLQKNIAAYAEVVGWIDDNLSEAEELQDHAQIEAEETAENSGEE